MYKYLGCGSKTINFKLSLSHPFVFSFRLSINQKKNPVNNNIFYNIFNNNIFNPLSCIPQRTTLYCKIARVVDNVHRSVFTYLIQYTPV